MELISEKEIRELMKIKGSVRGDALIGDAKFVVKEQGQEGLAKLEEAMDQCGYPINYEQIKRMDFYPISFSALSLVLMQRLFNLSDEDFFEFGQFHVKASLIFKVFLRNFVSLSKLLKLTSQLWNKYYTSGKFNVVSADEKNGIIVLRIKEFSAHRFHYEIIKGFVVGATQMLFGIPARLEEVKSIFKGDDYAEYKLIWNPKARVKFNLKKNV